MPPDKFLNDSKKMYRKINSNKFFKIFLNRLKKDFSKARIWSKKEIHK